LKLWEASEGHRRFLLEERRERSASMKLVFRDEFETLDAERWSIMTHSWPSNEALFGSNSVEVADGQLKLTLLAAPMGTKDGTGASKQFLGAEVRSVTTISAGRVTARAKFAKGSAVVSSLVTIYTPWPADNWNELDFETLGKDDSKIQSNVMVYTGPQLTLPVATSVTPTQDPVIHALGFDASEDFHEYTMEWSDQAAFFLIDGKLVRTSTDHAELLNLPQNVLLTIWASSSASWAGAIDTSTAGAQAVFDWVEVYSYNP
jgi:beta-glucanase (GH16 family)